MVSLHGLYRPALLEYKSTAGCPFINVELDICMKSGKVYNHQNRIMLFQMANKMQNYIYIYLLFIQSFCPCISSESIWIYLCNVMILARYKLEPSEDLTIAATALSEEKDKLVPENWRDRENISKDYTKPHAHLHSMQKTSAKFQNNWWKTVRRVAPARYPLSIHFDSNSCNKKRDLVHKAEKVRKNNQSNIPKPHTHLHSM